MDAETLGDLAIMIRQLRTELTWAARTGIVPPEVEPPPEKDEPAEETEPSWDAAPPVDEQEPPPPPDEEEPPPPEPLFQHPPAPPPREEPAPPPPSAAAPAPVASPAPKRSAVHSILGKCASLEEVREVLGECTRCKLAKLGRTNVVFGVGNPAADVMFIGEGPGADEDRQGEPFVGKAGQLLTKIIEGGMGLSRADVYIANIVKCRPPQNRDPEPDEVETCRPFVEAQIRLIQPKVIVTLGRYASQTLLGTTTSMTQLRGKWQEYDGIAVMPTFHPAYLLRNPAGKRPVWEDIQEVLKFLGRSIPPRGSST